MKLINSLVAVLIVLCLFASCNGKADIALNNAKEKSGEPLLSQTDSKAVNQLATTNNQVTENEENNTDSTDKFQEKKQTAVKNSPQANIDWDKKIIKTASLQLQVKDFFIYSSSLREKIKQSGGYIAQEEQNQSDYKIEDAVTIKVPVDQFDNAVALLTEGIEKVNEKKITSQDVTAEVIDTKSRLETKKQVRLRYLDFLKQAKNMEETLNMQRQVDGMQEEMEAAAGRINYLSHSALFSTINLTFLQVLNVGAKETQEPSFFKQISDAFKTGWSWIEELITGLVSIWPIILLLVLGFGFFKRHLKSKIKPV